MRFPLVASSAVLGLLVALASTGRANADPIKLKVGTAAAADSPWGHAFKTWKKAVEAKTSKGVSFDFFYGSTKGTEVAMVDKMKAGELDGAAVTSAGLAKYDRRLLIMHTPGLIRSWKTLDAIRAELGGEFEKMLTDKKVTLINWGDIGMAHTLSKGFAVHQPDDLKGHSPWVYADDPVVKTLYGKIPGVNPFSAELMQVLPNIENGKIDVISAPAIGAEMLQWAPKFDNGVDSAAGIAVGALIMNTDALDKLPADGKKAVVETGQAMGTSDAGLKKKLRNEDEAAWKRFKTRSGVTIYTPTEDDIKKWKPIFKATIDSLKGGTFDPALMDRFVAVAMKNQ
ncbi:MAG: TRAP transporter substrate-binding protein DctP [Polyangiales bacterium]